MPANAASSPRRGRARSGGRTTRAPAAPSAAVEDDRRHRLRAGVGAEQRDRLLGDARRVAARGRGPRRTPSRPARSSRRARSGSCASAPSRRATASRVDAAAALDELLLDVGALGGDEQLAARAVRARRLRDLDVLVPAPPSARRQSSTFSESGTSNGSRSDWSRAFSAARDGASSTGVVPDRPALARANATARSAAASRAPSAVAAGRDANPQAPSTRTRTPTLCLAVRDRLDLPFFVDTCCARRTTARASA